ncbi:ChrR family anti-sigma-E factor [Profundibacterium mesophilum]|uniref:Transcriptional activator ChrR n=1 Tax=Profundibacterium mesophilum KAUST100406-0324 TaxID=1037889 RepID=A0A921NQN9_9RHOB|nr:ChrR family anti-sigma-E factor [Profundibacterium mesophilum]KAF0676582.1 Transcriptional activator ChrR [Profundibacterium mesophilum KAUST100406-0324]
MTDRDDTAGAPHAPAKHPGAALLSAYAAGTLSESFDLTIAAHVSLCDACRAEVMSFEALGGGLLETMPPAPLARAMPEPAADRRPQATPGMQEAAARDGDLPAPLERYAGTSSARLRWRAVGGGVMQIILKAEGPGRARLLRIPGGMAMPHHGHRGIELTLVLGGAFHDGTERFARGDMQVAAPALEHMPVAEEGQPCICLAVTDAPLRFTSLLPRLAQPFLRI